MQRHRFVPTSIIKHPRPARDLSGTDVHALRVVGFLGKDDRSVDWFLCLCRLCQREKAYRAHHLRAWAVKSCGAPDCRRLVRRVRARDRA